MKASAISSLNLRAHGRSVLTSLLSQIDFSMDKMNEIFLCSVEFVFMIIFPVEIQNQTIIFIILELLSSILSLVLLKSWFNQMSNENAVAG